MGDIIGLVSGKGGVGKTTITATVGALLSEKGYKVLICDGDFGMRDLDLVLGLENEVCFDAYNAMEDKDLVDDVLLEVKENLYFLPASQQIRWEDMGRKKFRKLIHRLADSYDYVLIDAPAGIGRGLESIVEIANRFLIITQPLWVSIRNAARAIQFCRDYGHRDYVVLFNSLSPVDTMPNLYDMLDALGAEYVGTILPYVNTIVESTQNGNLIGSMPKQYKSLLEPVVDYITTGDAWDEQDVLDTYEKETAPPVVEPMPSMAVAVDETQQPVTYTNRWSTQRRVVEGKQSMWRRKRLK